MIGLIRFVAVLSGLGALALTVFFGWVLIDARVNDRAVYTPPTAPSVAATARR